MRQLFFRAVPLAVALALATPALASAAQSLAVTSPTGFRAGGDPTYTTTTSLDTSAGTPSKVKIAFAPGVLASTTANPSCITGAPQYTPACQIGDGSATILGLPIPFKAYLVKPPSNARPRRDRHRHHVSSGRCGHARRGRACPDARRCLDRPQPHAVRAVTVDNQDECHGRRDVERQAVHADADQLLARTDDADRRLQQADRNVQGLPRLRSERVLVASLRPQDERVARQGRARQRRRRHDRGDPGRQ